jgi:hypothetical protein
LSGFQRMKLLPPAVVKDLQNRQICLESFEADDGARTRDTWLGKPVLYRLSYVRAAAILAA